MEQDDMLLMTIVIMFIKTCNKCTRMQFKKSVFQVLAALTIIYLTE